MIFPDDEPPFTPLLNSGGDVKRDPAGRELSHHQSVQDHLKIKLMTMVMPFILQQVCFLNSNDDNFFSKSNRWGWGETILCDIEDEDGDNEVGGRHPGQLLLLQPQLRLNQLQSRTRLHCRQSHAGK